jgi:hypothetical protein
MHLAGRAQAKKSYVDVIDLVTGAGLELLVKRLEQVVADLTGAAATAADQVVVVAPGDLIHELTIPDMRGQHQALLGQEAQCAVDGRIGQAGQRCGGFLADGDWGQVGACLREDIQDRHALGRHPKTMFM